VNGHAKILGVRVSELLGESVTEYDEAVNPVGYAVQRALMCYPAGIAGEPDLVSLRGRVDAAWSIRQGSPHRYTEASDLLPGLVTDVQAARRALGPTASEQERREVQRVSADVYFLLRTFTKRIGRTDLSLLVADRGVLAAEAADDPNPRPDRMRRNTLPGMTVGPGSFVLPARAEEGRAISALLDPTAETSALEGVLTPVR
jgi:hypothetical protein